MAELETISGVIDEIYYVNEENGYTACSIFTTQQEYYDLVGYMPLVREGQKITASGHYSISPTYGEQFKVEYYETVLPSDEDEILTYLSSGIVEGVRAATAKKLVEKFGKDTLTVMLTHPERMSEIKGISEARAEKIGIALKNVQSMQGIVIFLQKYGVSVSYAGGIYQSFGTRAVDIISENPYLLADNIQGISFGISDKIAMNMGLPKNSIHRIKSAIKYTLKNAAYQEGHTFMPRALLSEHISYFIGVREAEIENAYTELLSNREIILQTVDKTEVFYLFELYEAEEYIARRLLMMAKASPQHFKGEDKLQKRIQEFEEEENVELAAEQHNAVFTALSSKCMVITGGPGTGKTTTINAIIKLLKKQALRIALAAPTGRAAKRMSQVTGLEAKTIHRLLETEISGGEHIFKHNETNPLSADVVIVDEASMIDTLLMASLLRAVKYESQIIFVGDSDQLPPVGPGTVLKSIVESNAIPVIKLSKIFRQAQESLIIVNAHKINCCEMPELDNKTNDFFFLRRESLKGIAQTTVDLYANRLPRSYNADPLSHIQVISPTKKTETGTVELNAQIQKVVNPPSPVKNETVFNRIIFRTGDKVMQTRNNYDIEYTMNDDSAGLGIFNGDMGIIEEIYPSDRMMTILFDDEKRVEYSFDLLKDLDLAYAITVHKSQGSEFPIVVIPVGKYFSRLMNKNLFYTAVTRARDMVVLVGAVSTIKYMTQNTTTSQRYTGLYEKLVKGKSE